ncbi:Nn.00g107320.m01.CDS01 [Neocucurbitaria sp. VM-36]
MAAATRVQHSKFDPQHINPGLDVVYPNDEQASPKSSIKVDIIAIPGLGANPEWTWKHEKVDWLRDPNMLARKIPNCRISVFQYQSQWFGRGSVNQRIENVANQLLYALDRSRGSETKTPIIFVCHCLGGIILEKALLTSRLRQNDFPSVYPWVAGCIFLGTPFHGTKTQSKALVLAQMAETIGWGTPSDLVKILEKDSEILNSLLEDFALLARDAQIRLFCFFEQEKSDLVGLFIKGSLFKSQELIVDEASATITSVEKLGLKSDHFHLNKYDGPKDGNFKYVSEEIRVTAQKAEGILKTRQNQRRQALVNDRTYHTMIDHLGKGFQDIDAAKNGSFRGIRGSKLSSVLELENYKIWQQQSSVKVLWVHGRAGTGQGAIASSALEFLQRSREHGSIVTSFFCDQSDKQRRSLKGLLQMVVRQIIDLDQDLARHLLSDSTKSKDAGKQDFDAEETLRIPALWDALHKMAKDLPGGSVFIVLYGLEQLSEESLPVFLQYMKELLDLEGPIENDSEVAPIKWLLLSRSGRPSIEKALKSKALEVNLEDAENSAQVSDDLRTHISINVDELPLPASLAYFVKRHIHSRAEDNWIYVSLVIQELKNAWYSGQTQHADIRRLLESFPYGLTDMFEHVRKRVLDRKADGFEYTKEILRCRICAYVAPTLRELAVLAGLPSEDQKDLNKLKAYIVRCGAFLTLRGDSWDEANNTVEWIDISAQEHLEKYAKDDLSLDLRDMQHGIIALRSLEYIYYAIEQKAAAQRDKEVIGDDDDDASIGEIVGEEDNINVHSRKENGSEHDGEDDTNAEDDDRTSTTSSGVEDEDDAQILPTDDLKYLTRYWVEHAKKAPRDVLEEFNFHHPFWQDETNARQEWWHIIEDVHARSGQTDVSVLHVAVILTFPELVDYLLENGWRCEIHKKDSLGFQPLYYACEGGQEEIVDALLRAGADINYVNDSDKPAALHAAASNSHSDIVMTLLNNGANVDATSPDRGTALYAAAANADNEILKLLLDRGAKVNIIGGASRRALNIAAFNGNLEAVCILIERGADIDPNEDYWYGSALGAAARRGHDDVAKFLLSHGWNPNRPMKTYGSFLTAAATYNHLNVFETLLKNEGRELMIEQALQAAAQRGYAPIVKAILEKTISNESFTLRPQKAFSLAASYGRTEVLKLIPRKEIEQDQLDEALYQATDNEHEETVKLLLEFNANPNAEGPDYGYALIASAYDGTIGIMTALIEAGADVNKRGGTYGTALQAASWFGDAHNVKLLIDHGANLNTDPIGFYGTELTAAVYTGNEETIRLLLKEGANVNAFGGTFSYPIVAAVEQGRSEAVRILLEHNAHVNVRGGEDKWPVISLAASTLQVDDLRLILKNVADINATCEKGTTALINCADACDAEGLQFLLDNGADVHVASEEYGTALHAAAAEGDEDCCEVLLRAGAYINAIGGPYGTALQAAAWAEDIETVKILLDAGADITIAEPVAGEYGTTLQAASAAGSLEIVQELLDRNAVVNVSPANGKFGSSLSAAAAGGYEEIVKLLIKHKADVNAKGGLYGFPILAAAQSGNSDIVQLLLDAGANAAATGGLLGSAVAAAAYANNLYMIKQLIAHNADVHAKGGKYGNAIQAATIKADTEVIDDLVNRAVDLINHRDGKYHTALIAASYFNRMEVVTKLLNGGADFRFQGGKFRSTIAAAAMRGNKMILDKLLSMGPPDHLLDEALVAACAHRQSVCVEALLKAGANVYSRHPTLGLPVDALAAPEEEDENSDLEDEIGEESDEDEDEDEDEDDEEEEDDEWEGDNISVSGQTDEGSVTDLELEEDVSEETKIQKLLEEAMARCKRNPTVKRFRTVKHRALPHSLSIRPPPPPLPPVPSLPSLAAYKSYDSQDSNEQFSALYEHHSQKPWNPRFRSESGTERTAAQYERGQSSIVNDGTYTAPLFAEQQVRSPPSSTPRAQSPQDARQRQYSVPSHLPERQSSSGSATSIPQSYTPPPRQGSQDKGLRRQSKALARKPLVKPGSAGKYQERQSSYPKPPGPDRSTSEHDYAMSNQNTPPLSAPHTSPPITQQYPPPLSQRQSQLFHAIPPSQYSSYSAPPVSEAGYNHYYQSSETSSAAPSVRSSQYDNSIPYGAQSYATRDTPASSQASLFNDAQNPNDARGMRWDSGGYNGEGYG